MLKLYCTGCECKVYARLTDGSEIYPHREDLADLPYWICEVCGNYVGCHYKTQDRTKPLGNIPTKKIREARAHIHRILDPLWKSGAYTRTELYKIISNSLGYKYHTANIKSIKEAKKIWKIIKNISNEVNNETNI